MNSLPLSNEVRPAGADTAGPGDAYGIRTHVTGVKNRGLNHLTNAP